MSEVKHSCEGTLYYKSPRVFLFMTDKNRNRNKGQILIYYNNRRTTTRKIIVYLGDGKHDKACEASDDAARRHSSMTHYSLFQRKSIEHKRTNMRN